MSRIRSRGHTSAKWSLCTEVVWLNKSLKQCRCFCTTTIFFWPVLRTESWTLSIIGVAHWQLSLFIYLSTFTPLALLQLVAFLPALSKVEVCRTQRGFTFDKMNAIVSLCSNGHTHVHLLENISITAAQKKCIKYTSMYIPHSIGKNVKSFTKHVDNFIFLIIIPVQEKQGKWTHHKEKEDPYSKSSIVFDGLWGEDYLDYSHQ